MPSKRAQQLCPQLIFVYPRFDAYKEVSHQLRSIFERYTDLIEPLSLDEAFLDVTHDKQGIGSALEIARLIKLNIKDELNLTASAGVSVNKFVAKIASDLQKPDGLSFIGPSRVESFIESLPVDTFYGVGKVTSEKMKGMGLFTGADLKKLTESEMMKHFGKTGAFYYKIVRGIDDRPVVPHREIKSIAAEDTFPYDLTTREEMVEQLQRITAILYNRLESKHKKGRTITLKIKYHDFKLITRSQSFTQSIQDREAIAQAAVELLLNTDLFGKKIRLLGISISNFVDATPTPAKEKGDDQLTLF